MKRFHISFPSFFHDGNSRCNLATDYAESYRITTSRPDYSGVPLGGTRLNPVCLSRLVWESTHPKQSPSTNLSRDYILAKACETFGGPATTSSRRHARPSAGRYAAITARTAPGRRRSVALSVTGPHCPPATIAGYSCEPADREPSGIVRRSCSRPHRPPP